MPVQSVERVMPGPLHPDFFDGETPMLVPVPETAKVYDVEVTFKRCEFEFSHVRILADTVDEALKEALILVRNREDDEVCFDFEATGAELAEEQEPSEDQIADYAMRREGE